MITKAKADKLFELYYSLGTERSLNKLAELTKIDFMILTSVADAYGWEQRGDARDADAERVKERKYRKQTAEIKEKLTTQIGNLLKRMQAQSLGMPFEIKSPNDLRAVAQAYQHLMAANTVATTQVAETSKDKTPRTWSDLLDQSSITDEMDEDYNDDNEKPSPDQY